MTTHVSSPFRTLYPSDALAEQLNDRLSDVEAAVRSLTASIRELTEMFQVATNLGSVRPLPVRSTPRLEKIMVVVAEKLNGGRPLVLTGHQRDRVRQRHLAMALARDQGYSYGEIGIAIKRHHTTVIHGIRKAQNDPMLEVLRKELLDAHHPV